MQTLKEIIIEEVTDQLKKKPYKYNSDFDTLWKIMCYNELMKPTIPRAFYEEPIMLILRSRVKKLTLKEIEELWQETEDYSEYKEPSIEFILNEIEDYLVNETILSCREEDIPHDLYYP